MSRRFFITPFATVLSSTRNRFFCNTFYTSNEIFPKPVVLASEVTHVFSLSVLIKRPFYCTEGLCLTWANPGTHTILRVSSSVLGTSNKQKSE